MRKPDRNRSRTDRKTMTREESIEFYKAHARKLFNISLRIVGNDAEAEEIAQDTILKFITGGCGPQGKLQTDAWLARTCARKSIDVLRKRHREQALLNEYAAESSPLTDGEDNEPEPAALNGITVAEVRKAMETLPEQYRAVLSLVLLEGFDYEEIAGMSAESEGTVRTRFSRARARLVEMLKSNRKGKLKENKR
jgi:RNA polymerase sigma factor (sigma-70 family)